jgi:ribulose-phosphate 3-epimerase
MDKVRQHTVLEGHVNIQVIPGILEDSWPEVERKVTVLGRSVNWIHIDVSDGRFTPRRTWQNPAELERLLGRVRPSGGSGSRVAVNIEVHLMTERPWEHLEQWIAASVQRFIVHWEACMHAPEDLLRVEAMFSRLKALKREIVFGLKLETEVPNFSHYASGISGVLLMAHEIGYSGRPFHPEVFRKIDVLRARYPNVTIEVDGGINDTNIADVVRAGGRRIVATTFAWAHQDPVGALDVLLRRGQAALTE